MAENQSTLSSSSSSSDDEHEAPQEMVSLASLKRATQQV